MGDFTITANHLPSGWKLHNNDQTIILFSMDGSNLVGDKLFDYDGDLSIESMIISDWYGSDVHSISQVVVDEYALESAYPNPFNPVTNFSYSIAEDGDVVLAIYNLHGQVLETLVNDYIVAGKYSVTWNADRYSSGVYFVHIISGEFMDTQKLMLVK